MVKRLIPRIAWDSLGGGSYSCRVSIEMAIARVRSLVFLVSGLRSGAYSGDIRQSTDKRLCFHLAGRSLHRLSNHGSALDLAAIRQTSQDQPHALARSDHRVRVPVRLLGVFLRLSSVQFGNRMGIFVRVRRRSSRVIDQPNSGSAVRHHVVVNAVVCHDCGVQCISLRSLVCTGEPVRAK